MRRIHNEFAQGCSYRRTEMRNNGFGFFERMLPSFGGAEGKRPPRPDGGSGFLSGILPDGIDTADILLLLVLLFLFIESGDEEFIIILVVIAVSIFGWKIPFLTP